MRIASWNIHRCFGTDRRYRPERIAEVLRSFDADVIALQEVDSSLRVEGEIDQLTYLANEVGMNVVMGPTMSRDYGAYGNALLSAHEFLSHEEYDLSYRRFEPRGALVARLRGPGGEMKIVNTHLGLKYWERTFQIDRLLEDLVRDEGLVVLLGDFNEWFALTPNNRRLEKAFPAKTPRLATFPAHWPRFALDRIFLSKAVREWRVDVPRTSLTRVASDHLPLVLDFEPHGDSII